MDRLCGCGLVFREALTTSTAEKLGSTDLSVYASGASPSTLKR